MNIHIKYQAPAVGGSHVKLRVQSKPKEDGARPIDVVGRWGNSERVTTRRLTTALTPTGWQSELQDAAKEAIAMAEQEASGAPVAVQRTPVSRPNVNSTSHLGRQVAAAQAKIELRAQNRGISSKEKSYHLRWLSYCQAYCERTGVPLSMASAAAALLDHYKDRKLKSYKDATSTLKWVTAAINSGGEIPDHLLPLYRYEVGHRDIPADALICERLKSIADLEQRRLVYSIVCFGHRVSHIHFTQWSDMRPDGRVRFFSPKNRRRCVAVPIPFGDEQINLEGWQPESHDQLKCYDKKPSDSLRKLHVAEASRLSTLVSRHLGTTATALRHRWAIRAIQRNLFPNLTVMARACGSSAAMLEQTYSQELDIAMFADDE